MKVAILGCSGRVGKETMKCLSEMGMSCTGFSRDPHSEKLKDMMNMPNITLKAGDMCDESSMKMMLKGFDMCFVICPGHQDRTKVSISAINACKEAKVKHIMVVSVLTCDKSNQMFGKQFKPIEDVTKLCGIPYTILRLPLFMDNHMSHCKSIKEEGTICTPQDPEAMYSPICVHDIGMAAAMICMHPEMHANKTYNLVTKCMSMNDMTRCFSKCLGKPVKYVRCDYPTAKKMFMDMGMPEWQTEGVLELFQAIDNRDPLMCMQNSDFKTITGRDPMTMEMWVQGMCHCCK
jgi:uncharacterized protein YbjT (DUF2867 family)